MSIQDKYRELEEAFEQRLGELGELYESEAPAEDAAYLCPLLNSLREGRARYEDKQFVCAGGEKRIFSVRDLRTDRVVAMAQPLHGDDDLQKEQFLREARVTADLQHPNILTAYDVGIDGEGIPYFTMEWVQGDTIKDIIEKLEAGDPVYAEAFPLSRLLDLFVKICDGVAYAHARGVLHLDIKPSNIKIGPYGEALLCDWGLANVIPLDPDPSADPERTAWQYLPDADLLNDVTLTGIVKGTPGFMAPEQGRLQGNVSEQTDIYSLGAVLYFMLTHCPPVVGNNLKESLEKTIGGHIPSPSQAAVNKGIPYGLEAVVMKALSAAPEDRYASEDEFRKELDRYRTGFATLAQDASAFTLLRLLVQRRYRAFVVAAASSVLLVAVVLFNMVRLAEERQTAVQAQLQAEEHFRQYKEETAVSRALSDNIRATALDVINTEDFLNAPSKISALESHLSRETDPGRVQVLTEYLAILHFVQQDFQTALDYFGRHKLGRRYETLHTLAQPYEGVTHANDLNEAQFAELLAGIPRHIKHVTYYSAFYYFRNRDQVDPEKALPIVVVLLNNINNRVPFRRESEGLEFLKGEHGRHLKLTGTPYALFHMPIPVKKNESNVLKSLDLYSLDLSHVGFFDPEWLHGMVLSELTITGMKTFPAHKFYVLDRIRVQRVFHTLEQTDRYLQQQAPHIDFVRLPE